MLLASAYNIVVPVFEQPDEHVHYHYAQHVAWKGRMPDSASLVGVQGSWPHEGYQPPLFYHLAAPLARLAGRELKEEDLWANDMWYSDHPPAGNPAARGRPSRFVHRPAPEAWPWSGYALAVHLGRALSTLLGMITVVCAHFIASRVLKGQASDAAGVDSRGDSGPLALTATALVAFNPRFLAVSSTFGNDALLVALCGMALVLLLRIWDRLDDAEGVGPLALRLVALAVVVGLAPLVRMSGLALLGFSLGTVAFLAWRHDRPSLVVLSAVTLPVGFAILSGWWYLRELPMLTERLARNRTHPGGLMPDALGWPGWLRQNLWGRLEEAWLSSWAPLGWLTTGMPALGYALFSALGVAALGGLVVAWRRRAPWVDRPRLAWLGLWAVTVLACLPHWRIIPIGGQGRLLFPAITAGAVLVVAGLRTWVDGRHVPRLVIALCAGLFLFATSYLWEPIRAAYAGPRMIDEAEIPHSAMASGAIFGEGLTLVAVDVDSRVPAGADVPVTMYWRVDKAVTREGFIGVQLEAFMRDYNTMTSGTSLAYVDWGSTLPHQLSPGPSIYVDRRVVAAPGWFTEPAGGVLRIDIRDAEGGELWPIQNAEDPSDESPQWFVPMIIDPPPEMATDASAKGSLIARFDERLELFRPAPEPGDQPLSLKQRTLRLTDEELGLWIGTDMGMGSPVIWRVADTTTEPLQMLVRVLNSSGEEIATFDRVLETGQRYRGEDWLDGEEISEAIHWVIWDDRDDKFELVHVPGSRFTVVVGLSRRADQTRIPAYGPDGARLEDDMVILHEIEVTD